MLVLAEAKGLTAGNALFGTDQGGQLTEVTDDEGCEVESSGMV